MRLKEILHIDNFISTGLMFIFFLLVVRSCSFEFIDPFTDAFGDVELTDVLYSQLGKNENYREVINGELQCDTNIVLVNIGRKLNRGGIAAQLNTINRFHPKVVAIDVNFDVEKDPLQDSLLVEAMSKTKNLVLYSEGIDYNSESNSFENLQLIHHKFSKFGHSGYTNLGAINVGSDDNKFTVCRKFVPQSFINNLNRNENSFALKVCELFDLDAYEIALERDMREEYINYFGNINYYHPKPRFKVFEWDFIFGDSLIESDFKDKIVLLGYIGDKLGDTYNNEDRFFTPLNDKYIGKANPDMYGVVIHANIIAMMLERNYINVMPLWLSHILGFLMVFLTFASFRGIYNDHKIWYDGVTKILAIFESLILIVVIALLFDLFDYKFNLHPIYYAAILLSGDFLEVYYGFLKNIYNKIIKKENNEK